jgi:phosphotransferase system IIB component
VKTLEGLGAEENLQGLSNAITTLTLKVVEPKNTIDVGLILREALIKLYLKKKKLKFKLRWR